MFSVKRQNEPPPLHHELFVRRVKALKAYQCCFVSPCFHGVFVHWGPGRSLPHYEDKAACPGCKLGYPVKWIGYLHFINETLHKQEFLEVPNGAAIDLLNSIGGEGQLRGTRAIAKRGKGDKTQLQFELITRLELVAPAFILPQVRCPDKALRNMWGINEVKLKLAGSTDIPAVA